jgi:hypothetical protein
MPEAYWQKCCQCGGRPGGEKRLENIPTPLKLVEQYDSHRWRRGTISRTLDRQADNAAGQKQERQGIQREVNGVA